MKELNKWSAGKKVATILLAREMAASTGETFAYLEMLHKGESLRGFPAPPRVKEWLPLYRDSKRILHVIFNMHMEEAEEDGVSRRFSRSRSQSMRRMKWRTTALMVWKSLFILPLHRPTRVPSAYGRGHT